jgi:hypothetical protein
MPGSWIWILATFQGESRYSTAEREGAISTDDNGNYGVRPQFIPKEIKSREDDANVPQQRAHFQAEISFYSDVRLGSALSTVFQRLSAI